MGPVDIRWSVIVGGSCIVSYLQCYSWCQCKFWCLIICKQAICGRVQAFLSNLIGTTLIHFILGPNFPSEHIQTLFFDEVAS